ncbi:GNAT family N-acetyltransferase [Mucilaginibacter sp. R-33]|uniref:GNAT family N-acetyltransferase n=1 Tax=unclassified Mucilaginibacter TaxID=2617802 RepID=UPI003CEF1868
MAEISIEQIRPELTWRLRQRILYPESKLYEMEMEEDNHGYHFAAFKDNHIIAVVSLFNKGNDWQFRKFAVDETMQNMGIGRAVLQYITDFVLVSGGTRLWCNARLSAIPFYLKAGFIHTGNFFSKNGFDYEILEKELTPSLNQE